MKDGLGNDPVEFQLNVLMGQVAALTAILAATPGIKQADFEKAKESVQNSPSLKKAADSFKAVPNKEFALSVAMETIKKIQTG